MTAREITWNLGDDRGAVRLEWDSLLGFTLHADWTKEWGERSVSEWGKGALALLPDEDELERLCLTVLRVIEVNRRKRERG